MSVPRELRRQIEQVIIDKNLLTAPWYDQWLWDEVEGSHFTENTPHPSYPTGWTEQDTAQVKDLNYLYSFFHLHGTPENPSWAYCKRSGVTIEGTGTYNSFQWGPILFRPADMADDMNYWFGVYRNNGGAIDTNTFVRCNIHYSAASASWQVRGEVKDGTTQTNSPYRDLAFPVPFPIFIRLMIHDGPNDQVRVYLGTNHINISQNMLLDVNLNLGAVNWGTPWWQMRMMRGAGVHDYMLVGGIDYLYGQA
jgi:hypothetical protein